ncbi:hypothetical protein KOAAANKH_03527 [Brevundimonas sp. NIBR10]|nr:hypothetical protein KOAAANKH_03527 [Brevundimonas sp. NIBR10]
MRRMWRQAEKMSVAIAAVAAILTLLGVEVLSRTHPVLAYALGAAGAVGLVLVVVFTKGQKR